MGGKKVVAIIQAREGSTRLPGKVLKQVKGLTILEWMMKRVSYARGIDKIVIATTESSVNIQQLCKDKNWAFYIGSENDVLSRVINTANEYKADIIVDLTSDCPLVDPFQIDVLIANVKSNEYNYACNIFPRTWPDGFDIQIYTMSVLSWLNIVVKGDNRENTGWNFIREMSKMPRINLHNLIYNYKAFGEHVQPKMRLTLDYQEDFEVIQNIIEKFAPIFEYIAAEQIIEYVLDHPHILVNKYLEEQ